MEGAKNISLSDLLVAQRLPEGSRSRVASALADLGKGYHLFSAPKRRFKPRGTWKTLRRCKCR